MRERCAHTSASDGKRVAGGRLHSASGAGSRLRGCRTDVPAGAWRAAGSGDSRQRLSASTWEQQRMQNNSVFECECMGSMSKSRRRCNSDANAALLITCFAEEWCNGAQDALPSSNLAWHTHESCWQPSHAQHDGACHDSPMLGPRLPLRLQLRCPFGDGGLGNGSNTSSRHGL